MCIYIYIYVYICTYRDMAATCQSGNAGRVFFPTPRPWESQPRLLHPHLCLRKNCATRDRQQRLTSSHPYLLPAVQLKIGFIRSFVHKVSETCSGNLPRGSQVDPRGPSARVRPDRTPQTRPSGRKAELMQGRGQPRCLPKEMERQREPLDRSRNN